MRVTLKQTSNGLKETHTEKKIKLRKINNDSYRNFKKNMN